MPTIVKSQDNPKSVEKCYRYLKPRIGHSFQAHVEPFKVTNTEVKPKTDWQSDASINSNNLVRKKRGPGRPPRGGKVRNVKWTSAQPLAEIIPTLERSKSTSTYVYSLSSSSSNSRNRFNGSWIDNTLVPERGGLCVHRSTTASSVSEDAIKNGNYISHDEFLIFIRNLMLQTPRLSKSLEQRADYLWKEAVIEERYGNVNIDSTKLCKSFHRGRKRKLGEKFLQNDDNVRESIKVLKKDEYLSYDKEKDKKLYLFRRKEVKEKTEMFMSVTGIIPGLEEDELILQYLEVRNSGNSDRAKLLALSDLSMGRSNKTRKKILKRKKDEEMTIPLTTVLSPLSESWRMRYERLGQKLLGDTRSTRENFQYPFFGEDSCLESFCNFHPWMFEDFCWANTLISKKVDGREESSLDYYSISPSRSTTHVNDESLKALWKFILRQCQKVIDDIESRTIESPKLRDVLILLGKAYSIPKPEDIFGRRDSIPKNISQCMNLILDKVVNARKVLAFIFDSIHEGNDEGINLNLLKKDLEDKKDMTQLNMDEFATLGDMLDESLSWQLRLNLFPISECSNELSYKNNIDKDLQMPKQSLSTAQDLASDGRVLSLRPRSLVLLEERIERAYVLRDKIRKWNKSQNDESGNVKFIGSMIREAQKINLSFPELSVLSKLHKNAEEWIDRATVAIRSKISLSELEFLVKTGEKMPVDFSELLVKLRTRYDQACKWILRLNDEVPCPVERFSPTGNDLDYSSRAKWFLKMREALQFGDIQENAVLIDLCSQGFRIAVDIDFLQLLQVGIEAKNWTLKAKRWLPNTDGEIHRRGKIEDLREHLLSARSICKKANVMTDGKSEWLLECEEDLIFIVDSAERWFEKYRPFIYGDNRRSKGRLSISYKKLQQIVEEGDLIPATLGNSFIKINRIYSQGRSWAKDNSSLLSRCGIEIGVVPMTNVNSGTDSKPVTLEELNSAIDSATKDICVDLEEVKTLDAIAKKAQDWFDSALYFAPKRNKRSIRGKKVSKSKHSIEEVVALIEDAPSTPIDTRDDVERLKMQLSDIQTWRLQAQNEIRSITNSMKLLREARIIYYGPPENFPDRLYITKKSSDIDEASFFERIKESDKTISENLISVENFDEQTLTCKVPLLSSGKNVCKIIGNLVKSTESVSVISVEEEIAYDLQNLTNWWKKAADIIASPNNVFTEKRWIEDLEFLIKEGLKMLLLSEEYKTQREPYVEDKVLISELYHTWKYLAIDDKIRLDKLRLRRDKFYVWYNKAKDILNDKEKKIPLQVLKELADESSIYPSNVEIVKQIQKDASAAIIWAEDARAMMNSGETISIEEAKEVVVKGDDLNVTCPEFKSLRSALRITRGWANRVRKSGLEEGSAHIHEIKELIREHDSFLISIPEEVTRLKQAICSYCICRRPYDGFMIGCDECDEWYHGPCIGVSEAQAERVDKYVCMRCCILKVYKTSCNSIACVIRKWCDSKELLKARSQISQKHQRKVREKKREIMKMKEEIEKTRHNLEKVTKKVTQSSALESNGNERDISTLLNVNSKDDMCLNINEIEFIAKTLKANEVIEQSKRRLEQLDEILKERKTTEAREDSMITSLRYWCVMVRSQVFVPVTKELAESNYPSVSSLCQNGGDLLSQSMKDIIAEGRKFGILHFPDISSVINGFQCLAWCLYAFSVLRRKPNIEELKCLVKSAASIKLPEVKSVSMIRSMISRASLWQAKANKVLAPAPGETKPFDIQLLKDLRSSLNIIPITMAEESKLDNSLSDGGCRHCICGGPNDGKFMMECNKCEKRFHRDCVNVEDNNESQLMWICPLCLKLQVNSVHREKSEKKNKIIYSREIKTGVDRVIDYEDISPNAPDPSKLWPPFGLVDSPEAVSVLGNSGAINIEHLEIPHLPFLGSSTLPRLNKMKHTISQNLVGMGRYLYPSITVNQYARNFASTNLIGYMLTESTMQKLVSGQNVASNVIMGSNSVLNMSNERDTFNHHTTRNIESCTVTSSNFCRVSTRT